MFARQWVRSGWVRMKEKTRLTASVRGLEFRLKEGDEWTERLCRHVQMLSEGDER